MKEKGRKGERKFRKKKGTGQRQGDKIGKAGGVGNLQEVLRVTAASEHTTGSKHWPGRGRQAVHEEEMKEAQEEDVEKKEKE
ncbi:hypothetical protein E2C01_086798 [Portunus trituberculatus]|uniref:Uncharacterized protein n=1 Tax=Portunus trituberculatus TaxID=210409 RepID=A0A5B7J1T1_PORTR|nr:hypothetical protein [Portunus trituberculatus]